MPVEMVWSHLKYGLLSNFVPRHVKHLDKVVQEHLTRPARATAMIKSLWAGSRLVFLTRNWWPEGQ
jgi:hypothetical protein